MAIGILSKPEPDEPGPCVTCSHTDCAKTKAIANTICRLCDKIINYEKPFYKDDDYGYVHAACLEDVLSDPALTSES